MVDGVIARPFVKCRVFASELFKLPVQNESLFNRMDCLGTIHLETERFEEGHNFNDAAIIHRGHGGTDSEVPRSGDGDGYSGDNGGGGDKECLLSMNGIAIQGRIQQ